VTLVNDIHSELNETTVASVIPVDSVEAVRAAILDGREHRLPIAIAGGRHAMGGQQFCTGGTLLDTSPLRQVLEFDRERGLITVEAGIQWPQLLDFLHAEQVGDAAPWAFRQKQTGADRLSVGGAISANAHGRGLSMKPFVSDIESLTVVDAQGEVLVCDRDQNAGLFSLVAGGYGLFGCVVAATLRLMPRRVLERVVEVRMIDDLPAAFEDRIKDGFLYGDFQFATDPASGDFLRRGVFSCYRPVEHSGTLPSGQRALAREDWTRLIALAHTDKSRAFDLYATHYLATSGQLYDSDSHQLADYEDGYHRKLDAHLGATDRATEMISEVYVPRDLLADFMRAVADDFRTHEVEVVYGTIRLIERDDESFLPWASDRWACVIFNLHTVHTKEGLDHSAQAFRRLIDHASDRGGTYFLTYHRWATKEQIQRGYPRFVDFLRRKLEHDPDEVFQSDWYRHQQVLFASELGHA
jgi:FAD/FMN-containing dehydrogenase